MDARSWLGLEPTHNPHRWWLPITPGISTGHRFLFGGCGLGAAIAALEGTTGRPVVWASAQYLSYAKTGGVLDVDVTIAVEGHATTQARAIGHVGGTEIITVNAALGRRPYPASGQFAVMPDVTAPEDSPEREFTWDVPEDSLNARLEERWALPADRPDAPGPVALGEGRWALWTRMPELLEPSAASLAVLGDFVPMGLGLSLDGAVQSNSLDNTLRVIRPEPSDWFLLEIFVGGVHHGFGHGHVHIWTRDGVLAAIGSQSATVRERPADGHLPPRRLADSPG